MNVGVLGKLFLGQSQTFPPPANRTSKREARESGCLCHASLLLSCRLSIYRRSSTHMEVRSGGTDSRFKANVDMCFEDSP
jgi:hypothetical protein